MVSTTCSVAWAIGGDYYTLALAFSNKYCEGGQEGGVEFFSDSVTSSFTFHVDLPLFQFHLQLRGELEKSREALRTELGRR